MGRSRFVSALSATFLFLFSALAEAFSDDQLRQVYSVLQEIADLAHAVFLSFNFRSLLIFFFLDNFLGGSIDRQFNLLSPLLLLFSLIYQVFQQKVE